jgi:hypothetical protein
MDREAELLDHLEEHARWVISGGAVWGVAGVLLFAGLSTSAVGVVFSAVMMFRLASAARKALAEPTVEARLEIMVGNTGYGGMPHESAMLLPAEPTALATFGTFYAVPWLTAIDGVSAKVHGKPVKRALVVVSCPECALVGRIRRSNFGKAPRPVSPMMAFLMKRRTLRLH